MEKYRGLIVHRVGFGQQDQSSVELLDLRVVYRKIKGRQVSLRTIIVLQALQVLKAERRFSVTRTFRTDSFSDFVIHRVNREVDSPKAL